MNRQRRQPVALVPRTAAAAVVRAAREEAQEREQQIATEFFGQQGAPVGMGEAPELRHSPGGDVLRRLQHPAFTTQEQLYRALPEEGWYDPDVNARSPVQFQLGSYQVPKDQALWVFDYEFAIYRLSGIDAGDFVRAEDGRFANQIGFDITINGRRGSTISYQLDPQAVAQGRQAFQARSGGPDTPADAFNRAASNSFASTAGTGTSLLPAWRKVQGPENQPFTMVVGEGAQVSLNVVIFNTVRSPLAFIEGREAGYLINQSVSSALLNRLRPR